MSKLKPPITKLDHVRGNANAPVSLVEYGDFQCPNCGEAYPIVEEIVRELGHGLRFAYRHFPLSTAHPLALSAAIAAEAAGRQRKFWPMHHIIFENQQQLSAEALWAFAETIGLDMQQFEKDINDRELEDKVDADFESGVRSGVNGTPTFFINEIRYNGGYDRDSIMAALQKNTANHGSI
ncbi:DsbA family protein [Chitinophaga sp. GCM10012297]|uniref:Thioredoxin domain-containing protein n=1 Tax=Chitinophaga chungangae TaxID=2821488 RepID=A0ABS3YLT8_9BACT|nr:thioredoxin domain-containing protein [Chitinophaga chungangae]MBO9155213.1 thioredoxin domain-containing protein [Chitinophaga chungangae]